MKVINSNRFWLPGTNNRFLHLGTVHYGTREFMAFRDALLNKTYIEELVGGQLQFISDDSLAQDLAFFFTYNHLLEMDRPDLPDKEWYNKGKNGKII